MKDVVAFQAEFGDWKKMVLAGVDLMAVASAKSTHCIPVDCSDGDVPYSEGLLQVAHRGTPVILFGKATSLQEWLDQNTRAGASQVCNFSTTMYLGLQEERQLYLPNPKLAGFGWVISVALFSLCSVTYRQGGIVAKLHWQ